MLDLFLRFKVKVPGSVRLSVGFGLLRITLDGMGFNCINYIYRQMFYIVSVLDFLS